MPAIHANAKAPQRSLAFPQSGKSANLTDRETARKLQNALFLHKCYGNLLSRQDEQVDGSFGNLSRRAFWVFADTFRKKTKTAVDSRFVRSKNFLTILNSPQIEEPYCKGSEFLATWFDDKNLHNPGQGLANAPLTCVKDDVSANYLDNLQDENLQATKLGRPLRFVIEQFRAVFKETDAPGLEPSLKPGSDAGQRLKTRSAEGVTYQGTLKAPTEAEEHFNKLGFWYGLQSKDDCKVCFDVNDWLFLRNIAQADGGYLLHTGSTGVLTRVNVNEITENTLKDINGNIRIYRQMTVRWNQLLENAQYLEAQNAAFWTQLNIKRKDEMQFLVAGLIRSLFKSPDPQINRLMKNLEKDYKCLGFDDTALGQ